jgi:hypothetical protein
MPSTDLFSTLFAGSAALSIALACGGTALTIGFIALVFVIARRIGKRMIEGDPEIAQNGLLGKGRILSIEDTGVRVGGEMNIRCRFQLEVTPDGGSSYQAEALAIIPLVNLAQFQAGAVVPVKIHPTDPSKVILDIYAPRTTANPL